MAAGKAAGSMAAAAEAHYLGTLGVARERVAGLVIARHGYGVPLAVLEACEAGHPVPDQAGLEATARMITLAKSCGPDDLVVFLLSGGASANLVAPMGAITLTEKQALTRDLLRAGVAIDGINIIRKHISRVKGGRLAQMIAPAKLVTIALSDVPGDDLSAIGSGPTIPDHSTLEDARHVLARYAIAISTNVEAVLADPLSETPKKDDPSFENATAFVAARPQDAFLAARMSAEALGYQVHDLGAELEGEARALGAQHAARILEDRRSGAAGGGKHAYLSGGELTVTIRGNGRGGPNQEYALALALALGGAPGIVALAADTDGTDGGVGAASDPAGAFVDSTTLDRAVAAGLDAKAMLMNNDSTRFFAAIEDLHVPGPTLTNANDLRVLLVCD